jgi:hypothetical protein
LGGDGGGRVLAGQQGLNEVQARGEALPGRLGQGPGDQQPVLRGQGRQGRLAGQVQQHQLVGVLVPEGHGVGEQLLVDNGQAVLVAGAADAAAEDLRRGVQGGDAAAARRRVALGLAQAVDQAKVGHLDVVADDEQVVRLDVEVLQAVREVHPVQGLGRLQQEAQQFLARDAGLPLGLVLALQRVQAAVGQLHDDDQHPAGDLDPVQRQDERVADVLDALQRGRLLRGRRGRPPGIALGRADELDGLEQAAGDLALPDLAEAAATQRLDEPVARDGLLAGLPAPFFHLRHGGPPPGHQERDEG